MADTLSFNTIFHGKMYGILTKGQLEKQWRYLRDNHHDWYVWTCEEDVPDTTMAGDDFLAFVDEAERFVLARDTARVYGFMYTNRPESPELVKVFDPKRMGSACGCSGEPVLPKWTISRMPPALSADPAEKKPQDRNKGKWWAFGAHPQS